MLKKLSHFYIVFDIRSYHLVLQFNFIRTICQSQHGIVEALKGYNSVPWMQIFSKSVHLGIQNLLLSTLKSMIFCRPV